ncbi:MAG: fumarylacetoacetate hydrolase family protein [Woeseiaceae bacterium]
MRLLTFVHGGTEQTGVRRGEQVVPITSVVPGAPATLRGFLEDGDFGQLAGALDANSTTAIDISDIEYRPIIPDPGKIICIGRNYAAHAAEGGAETPAFPEIFFRGATSLVGHRAPIVRPQVSTDLDYEGEFAFVIGKRCRHASEENALDFIAGYTLFNDATLRDYQRFSTQWTIGKNFDGTGACGPELVTADELPPGLTGMTLRTLLNGEQMQEGQTDDLVFPVRKLVAILSQCMTLMPGDVVVTGTPAGVGYARTPPVWMKAGDTVEVEIEGLGKLANTVEDEVI